MTVSVDGAQRYEWPVSTGRAGYDTPNGTFKVNRMDADHLSQEWDNAPMPHSMFFDMRGHAIHGFFDVKHLGLPVSHGCVRISPDHAAALFKLVQGEGMEETKVVVCGETPRRTSPMYRDSGGRRPSPSRRGGNRCRSRRPATTGSSKRSNSSSSGSSSNGRRSSSNAEQQQVQQQAQQQQLQQQQQSDSWHQLPPQPPPYGQQQAYDAQGRPYYGQAQQYYGQVQQPYYQPQSYYGRPVYAPPQYYVVQPN